MAEPPVEQQQVCADFPAALARLQESGARLERLWPADAPHTALLVHDGVRVRLTACPDAPPPDAALPAFRPAFLVARADSAAAEGRAGMLYRDLLPDRLGGYVIASHIAIPEGGPVADWVHFHRLTFQLLCVPR